mmetsp:Transcript_15672/g.23076  ORF Transcript_15672/g.23076 Transcript_15672/m.23076 type:complete len:186 (+) Transcript_15672:53-610(+)
MVFNENSISRRSSFVKAEEEDHESKLRQIREELQLRKVTISQDNNNNEFRRVQAELRKSRVNTCMASLQILDQKLTDSLIQKRSSSLPMTMGNRGECLDRRVTKTMIKRLSNRNMISSSEDANNNNCKVDHHQQPRGNATSRMIKRLSMNPLQKGLSNNRTLQTQTNESTIQIPGMAQMRGANAA